MQSSRAFLFVKLIIGSAKISELFCGGLSLGLALGKVYGPLAAFALALGLQLTSYLGSTPIFMVGGVSDSLLGLRLSSKAITFQFCGLAALIIIELFFIGGQTYFRKYRSAVSLVCLCLAVVVSSAPMFVQFPRFVNVSDFADGSECLYLDNSARINKDGRVCISLQHDHKLPEIISAWTQIQQKVRDTGIDNFPNKLYELPPGAGPDDGQLLQSGETATFTLTADKLDFTEKQTISVQWLADSIAVPTWCSGLWADEPPSEDFYALQDTARQLLQRIVDPVAAKSLSAEDVASFQANWNDLLQCKGLSQ